MATNDAGRTPRFGRDKTLAPARLRAARILTVLALLVAALLVILDLVPGFLASPAHRLVSAVPLAVVAVGYLIHQAIKRPRPAEAVRALLLASAFLFWAASQILHGWSGADVLNDAAIALFVLDLMLLVAGPGADIDGL